MKALTIPTLNPLVQVVNSYLDTVKTKKGFLPDQSTKDNFLTTCMAYELNPVKRQAYLTGYDSKNGPVFTFIVGIDGFTAIASRTGLYAGKDQAVFVNSNNKVDTCTVTVYRLVQNQKCAFTGQAFYDESVQVTDEYVNGNKTGKQLPNSMWAKMPRTMLEKCAFAKALRAAFPESLSGMYTSDEISPETDQAEQPPVSVQPVQSVELVSEYQAKEYLILLAKVTEIDDKKRSLEQIQSDIESKFGYTSYTELSEANGSKINKLLQTIIANKLIELQSAQEEAREPFFEEILPTTPI